MQDGQKEYLVTSEEMRTYDRNTIEYFGVPSMVLMERAALAVAEEIEAWQEEIGPKKRTRQSAGKYKRAYGKGKKTGKKALIAAGCGNNGGDGIAVGRLLLLSGYQVDLWLVGEREKCSRETARQIEIMEKYGCPLQNKIGDEEYDIIVDALFGVGLSRDLEGIYAQAVEEVNRRDAFVCAVDIPSGIHADTGAVMGTAVKADVTVTFAFRKLGHILYPGCGYAGYVVCRQIGITEESFLGKAPKTYARRGPVSRMLPKRDAGGNKGSFGKVLVIAGSKGMSGACELCAKSVYRTGAGMVKAVTPEENRLIIQQKVPEALLMTYQAYHGAGTTAGAQEQGSGETCNSMEPDESDRALRHGGSAVRQEKSKEGADMDGWFAQEMESRMHEAAKWADVIVAGPGIGQGEEARALVEWALTRTEKPLVLDADGINLLAREKGLRQYMENHAKDARVIVMTPHVGEFARLCGKGVAEVKRNLPELAKELADRYGCVMVAKDARTVVASNRREGWCLNATGNDGMATAGMGDVLAGVVGGLLAQGMTAQEAAETGVYLHGLAGDMAAGKMGRYGLMARDVAHFLPFCMKQEDWEETQP